MGGSLVGILPADSFESQHTHEEAGENGLNAEHDQGAGRDEASQILLRGRQYTKVRLLPEPKRSE